MKLKRYAPLMAALALLAIAPRTRAQSGNDARTAYEAFLAGRFSEAERAYRFMDAVGISTGDPDVNLALTLRAEGKTQEALPFWVKASLAPNADGFVFDQLGWSYLSAGDYGDARKAFLHGISRATALAQQAEGNFGLGLTGWMDDRPGDAREALRKALLQGPYILPAASLVMAWSALKMGDDSAALAYFRQSMDLDPTNLEALKSFALFERRIGEDEAAWNLCRIFLSFDPGDKIIQKMAVRTERYLAGNPEDFLPVRRLADPLLNPQGGGAPPPSDTKTRIRVDLFCDRDARPALATRIYFMCNVPFHVVAIKSGDVIADNGGAYQQWTAVFRPQSDVVEIRDAEDDLVYEARQPVRIEPQSKFGSVLIKSAVFSDDYGFDPGDRELRGNLEVWPTPYGFTMLNDVNLDDYLRGVVAAVLPPQSPFEAYKAQAVISRSAAYWFKAHPPVELQGGQICDSSACQKYLGVSAELSEATKAVKETKDVFLLDDKGKPARAWEHVECGGRTEAGWTQGAPNLVSVTDGREPLAPLQSPEDLDRWTHSFPPPGGYDQETDRMPPVASRWIRVLSEKDLERRAELIKYVGPIRSLVVTRRSPTGRVLSLRVEGEQGNFMLNGEKMISDFLSPGSLRSTLFTIQPLMDGPRKARFFLLWGAGTGSGLGLCEAGAIGQASIGRNWRQILAFYYPGFRIGAPGSAEKARPSRKTRTERRGRHRRPHNPHWHGS